VERIDQEVPAVTRTTLTNAVLPLAAAGFPATAGVVVPATAFERATSEREVPGLCCDRLGPRGPPHRAILDSLSSFAGPLDPPDGDVILFGAATAFGVSPGMSAPETSPTSVVHYHGTFLEQ
jgi:hypothetical protein